jgi:hypothetical protein
MNLNYNAQETLDALVMWQTAQKNGNPHGLRLCLFLGRDGLNLSCREIHGKNTVLFHLRDEDGVITQMTYKFIADWRGLRVFILTDTIAYMPIDLYADRKGVIANGQEESSS